jgi:hypothetical protein
METRKMSKTVKRMLPKGMLRAAIEDTPKIDEEKRTVELTWSTGYKGMRNGWDGPYFEELSMNPKHIDMSRLSEGTAPLLDSHNASSVSSVIGVVERAWLDGNEAKAVVRFASTPEADSAYQKVKERVLRNVSVGYAVRKYEDVTERGEDVPTYRATDWMPMEISLVPIGFDPHAQVRKQEDQLTECEVLETRLEQNNEVIMPQDNSNNESVDTKALEMQARKAEKERQNSIRNAVRGVNLDESFAQELIDGDVAVTEANERILVKVSERAKAQPQINTTVRVEIGTDEGDKKRDALKEALLHRMDSRNFQVTEKGRQFYGRHILSSIEAVVPRQFGESDVVYAQRVMSGSDLPYLLANVAEKGLQKQYETAPRTWDRWAKSSTMNNYKEGSQSKIGNFASLVERKEGQETTESNVTEEREVAQLKDYAIIHSFTSQMLVNDDLGGLQRLATQGGLASSRLENARAYSALTTNKTMKDSIALYHVSSHGANLLTAGAISATTVGEAYKNMRKQKGVGSRETLNLTPRYFICGPDQEVAARQFFASIIPNLTSSVNIFQGSMEVIVDAEITGNQYYFAADPNVIDTVVLFRLAGKESPTIDSELDFSTRSLKLRVEHTCAAEPMDWRGLSKNAGQ